MNTRKPIFNVGDIEEQGLMTPRDNLAEYMNDYKSLSFKEKTAYVNYWRFKYGIHVAPKDTTTKIANEIRRVISYNPDMSI